MAQMSLYLHRYFRSISQTFPELLVKIQHDEVILRRITSFPYIFLYYDVIGKNAGISKNNDVMEEIPDEIEFADGPLLSW